MKKTTLILTLLLITGVLKSNAQFDKENLSLGGGIAYYRYSSIAAPLSINLRGNYINNEKTSFVVNFNYHLPFSYEKTYNANASSSSTTPSFVIVPVKTDITMFNLCLTGHYSFIKENEDPFSMYGLGGLGITFATATPTAENYDKSIYNLSNTYTDPESIMGFIIDLGLGVNLCFDKVNVFGEAKIGFPANKANDTTIENPVPFHSVILVGARYSLFN